MQIDLTSTLTREDEDRLAPAVLKTLSGILDMLPIAYTIRVKTADEQVLQYVRTPVPAWPEMAPLPKTTVAES